MNSPVFLHSFEKVSKHIIASVSIVTLLSSCKKDPPAPKIYDYTTVWQNSFAVSSGNINLNNIVATQDGGHAIVGNLYFLAAGRQDAFVAKVTADGTKAWQKNLNATVDQETYGYNLMPIGTDRLMVTGSARIAPATERQFWHASLNADGSINSSIQSYGVNFDARFTSMITAATGFIGAGGDGNNTAVIKLADDGHLVWSKKLNETFENYGYAVAAATDGYIVAGSKENAAGGETIWIVKFDASGNKTSVEKTFAGTSTVVGNYATSIVAVNDGFVVTGVLNEHLWAARLDNNLNMVWEKTYDEIQVRTTGSILSSGDGFIVAGMTLNSNNSPFAVRLDKDGNKVWYKAFDAVKVNDDRPIYAAKAGTDGFVIAVVTSQNEVWMVRLKEQ